MRQPPHSKSLRTSGRSLSFQRSSRIRNQSSSNCSPDRPTPVANTLTPSRSFPSLTRLLHYKPKTQRTTSDLAFPESDSSQASFPVSDQINSSASLPSPRKEHTFRSPPTSRKISSSQRIRRGSFGSFGGGFMRSHGGGRTTSFGEGGSMGRVWGSSGSAFLSPRSATDDVLWNRLRPSRTDRMRRRRFNAYESSSDFEIAEHHDLVDIDVSLLQRLPDRAGKGGDEDIFGRRRRDFRETWDSGVLAYEVNKEEPQSSPQVIEENEETVRSIVKAIDLSKGRLRRSANMSRAFKSVIRSGEGWVRKSELIQATLDSSESKDPSVIILLDPSSVDATKGSTTSEDSIADDKPGEVSCKAIGFSTSMTAKQCAATLETLLREMMCRVHTIEDSIVSGHRLVRLKVVKIPPNSRRLERKVRVMVIIKEEDQIRTTVSFKRIGGLYSSRDSHLPLCADIRDKFQREWPAVVEALYIRLPNSDGIVQKQLQV